MNIGYVVKRYPRYSETFIVSEILAHETAGATVRIFALRPSFDSHFQNALSRVRAAVAYLGSESVRAGEFWEDVRAAAAEFPHVPQVLLPGAGETPVEVSQGIALARLARAAGIDHLHAHFATSAAAVARIASRLTGIPYTFTAHAKDIYHEEVDSAAFEWRLRDAAACVTVSDFNSRFLRARYSEAAGKVVRIYNGVDLSGFPFRSPAARPPTVLAVGRLVEKKGFANLIDACARLRSSGARFRCRIIGTGPLESALRHRIEEHALADVVSLDGPRPQAEVIRAMESAAVLAVPCVIGGDGDRDGLPTVMLEAMALGTPCVATPVTGIPEAVEDERSGLLVPENDPRALAAAVARLLNDAALRTSLAAAARQKIESDFDVQRNAAALRELFAVVRERGRVAERV